MMESRDARADAATLLRRPIVDQDAILAALARAGAADMTVRASVEERAVHFAATMIPQDRARLAGAMTARVRTGRR